MQCSISYILTCPSGIIRACVASSPREECLRPLMGAWQAAGQDEGSIGKLWNPLGKPGTIYSKNEEMGAQLALHKTMHIYQKYPQILC